MTKVIDYRIDHSYVGGMMTVAALAWDDLRVRIARRCRPDVENTGLRVVNRAHLIESEPRTVLKGRESSLSEPSFFEGPAKRAERAETQKTSMKPASDEIGRVGQELAETARNPPSTLTAMVQPPRIVLLRDHRDSPGAEVGRRNRPNRPNAKKADGIGIGEKPAMVRGTRRNRCNPPWGRASEPRPMPRAAGEASSAVRIRHQATKRESGALIRAGVASNERTGSAENAGNAQNR